MVARRLNLAASANRVRPLLAGVMSMSEGAIPTVGGPEGAPSTDVEAPLGAADDDAVSSAPEEGDERESTVRRTRTLLAPFRRKSMYTRFLLNETDRTTRLGEIY